MNQDKIMKGLRALMEAVSDSDGRSDQAQEIVDVTSRKLSKLYGFDFKEGGNVLGDAVPETIERLLPVELLLVGESGFWENKLCYVPKHIVEQESQDAFIKWLWSDEGAAFREEHIDGSIIGAYISSWPGGVSEDPKLDSGDIIFAIADGAWTFFSRSVSGREEDVREVFERWAEGVRELTLSDDKHYVLYTVPEAEYHFQKHKNESAWDGVHLGVLLDRADELTEDEDEE